MVSGRRGPSGNDRVSDLDRQRVLADIEAFAASGVIRGDEERKIRERKVRLALTRDQLDAALVDLRRQKRQHPKKGDLRASNAEREDAERRLLAYEARGYLDHAATLARIELVKASTTSNDVAAVFTDLPALAARAPVAEARVSLADQADALERLTLARDEHRITFKEFDAAKDIVDKARTRSEINAAFHGLANPRRAIAVDHATQVAKRAAVVTGRTVKAGGRRVVSAMLRVALALILIVVGVGAAIAGSGGLAVGCLLAAACTSVWALAVLVGPRRARPRPRP